MKHLFHEITLPLYSSLSLRLDGRDGSSALSPNSLIQITSHNRRESMPFTVIRKATLEGTARESSGSHKLPLCTCSLRATTLSNRSVSISSHHRNI